MPADSLDFKGLLHCRTIFILVYRTPGFPFSQDRIPLSTIALHRLSFFTMSQRERAYMDGTRADEQYGPEGVTSMKINPIRILILGPIGSGKSTFVAAAAKPGCNVETSDGGESCTQVCREYPTKHRFGQNPIMLIDTPGFEDPARDNVDILKEITRHVKGVSGIIYLHRCTDSRLDGDRRLNFEIIKAICGTEFYSRVVICSTFWDQTSGAPSRSHLTQHVDRMESLLNDPTAFGEVMKMGAEYREFWGNKEEPCLDVLSHFSSQRNAPKMAILDQLTKHHNQIQETKAGYIIEDRKKKNARAGGSGGYHRK
ncbi:hypothetical protein O1611_g8872 [Lasiodiplodia mahajangana]|uniref:Uncharacterized protein n=1 Tax=Lasiodiplodia mahajangana TaxID=1108764 RepID=A0ACC2JC60_9PEZI|nr:hypothetical protein O1611_g8872 [Lasiodiplodia mahajangana]